MRVVIFLFFYFGMALIGLQTFADHKTSFLKTESKAIYKLNLHPELFWLPSFIENGRRDIVYKKIDSNYYDIYFFSYSKGNEAFELLKTENEFNFEKLSFNENKNCSHFLINKKMYVLYNENFINSYEKYKLDIMVCTRNAMIEYETKRREL